jgi:hypothetical protein
LLSIELIADFANINLCASISNENWLKVARIKQNAESCNLIALAKLEILDNTLVYNRIR